MVVSVDGRRVLVVVRRSGGAAVRVLVSGIRVPSMVGDRGGRPRPADRGVVVVDGRLVQTKAGRLHAQWN